LPRFRSRVRTPSSARIIRRFGINFSGGGFSIEIFFKVPKKLSLVGWPRGEARDCKSLYTGSNPVPTSNKLEDVLEKKMSTDESQRPWGRYEILSESESHKVKTIWVNPGKRLSYQRHEKRAEHWFIVQGQAKITLNGDSFEMSAGDSIDIEIGDLHRIENIGSSDVIFIEVQTGTYFGEDDIERIEDDFGR